MILPKERLVLILKRGSLYLILIATINACFNGNTSKDQPIAQVYNRYLYLSDIQDIFPTSATAADSAIIIKSYTDRWVRRQLMLNRAERNLTAQQKNVTQQLDDYRSSLLIFRYEQEYIRQKLDTIVSQNEIEKFYENNLSNFILNENLVKALYIKLHKDDQILNRIKSLYQSTKEEDIKSLDNIAYQVAVKYDYFNDSWIRFSRINSELPAQIENPYQYLLRNRTIEVEDEEFIYLVSIKDVALRGSTSPLSFENENIRNIILNQRKQRLIKDLEAKIYSDGLNHNHFSIFYEM